jgi:hypothetical protein
MMKSMKIVLVTFLLLWSISASARALDSIDVMVYWASSIHPDTIQKKLDTLHSRQLALSLPSNIRLIRMPDTLAGSLNGYNFSYNTKDSAVGVIRNGTDAAGSSENYTIEVDISPLADGSNLFLACHSEPATAHLFITRNPTSVKVAILDAGVLSGNMPPNFPSHTTPIAAIGYDFVNKLSIPVDSTPNAHGHFVTSIISRFLAASDQVYIFKVLDGNGKGHIFDAIRAIDSSTLLNVNVLNMSFVSRVDTVAQRGVSPFQIAMDTARVWAGTLCIAAAGNHGLNIDTIVNHCEPAGLIQTASNLISVLSIGCENRLSTFSNRGKKRVTLGAYGEHVIGYGINNMLKSGSGTSFAAPIVTGAAVQLFSKITVIQNFNHVKQAIIQSVIRLSSIQDSCQTGGAINTRAADSLLSTVTVLAIKGIDFKARVSDGTVLLGWKFMAKPQKYQIALEKSKNNRIFERIFTSTNDGQINEEYLDTEPFTPATYYRLVTHGADGQRDTQYVNVLLEDKRPLIVFPNPVLQGQELVIQYRIETHETPQLWLQDMLGRKYELPTAENLGEGTYQKRISTYEMAAGVYDVLLVIGHQIFRHRIVIAP